MHTRDMRPWSPFTVENNCVTLAAPTVWRQPEEWERDTRCEVCGYSALDQMTHGDHHLCSGAIPVVNVLLPDLWAEYGHIVSDCDGWQLWVTENPREYVSQVSDGWKRRKAPLSFDAIMRDNIFTLFGICPHVTFWLPTRHPERVRERWPTKTVYDIEPSRDDEVCGDKAVTARLANVRLGLFAGVDGPSVIEWKGTWDQYWCAVREANSVFTSLESLVGGLFILREDGTIDTLGAE